MYYLYLWCNKISCSAPAREYLDITTVEVKGSCNFRRRLRSTRQLQEITRAICIYGVIRPKRVKSSFTAPTLRAFVITYLCINENGVALKKMVYYIVFTLLRDISGPFSSNGMEFSVFSHLYQSKLNFVSQETIKTNEFFANYSKISRSYNYVYIFFQF